MHYTLIIAKTLDTIIYMYNLQTTIFITSNLNLTKYTHTYIYTYIYKHRTYTSLRNVLIIILKLLVMKTYI